MSKLFSVFTLLLTVLLVDFARAERFTIPNGLEGQLVFENQTTQGIEVYQKFPVDQKLSDSWENSFWVKPGGSFHRDMDTLVRPLQFESVSPGLRVWVKSPTGDLVPVTAGASSRVIVGPLQVQGQSIVLITNFSSQSQAGKILSRSLTGRPGPSQSFTLKAYESVQVPFRQTLGSSLEIEGDYPLGAVLKVGHQTDLFQPKIKKFRKSDNPGVLFLLSNENRTQSYLVRLTDPAQIQQAREQISNPTGWRPRILVGQVALGSNRDNQNLLGPFKHMWSWHISKVFRFAELASQSCDGSPQFIEDILPAWVGGAFNGGSTTICFWGYQVTEEL